MNVAVGQCARTFYVVEGVTEADVKAKYENGILELSIPKKEARKVDNKKTSPQPDGGPGKTPETGGVPLKKKTDVPFVS